jgi:hypothetical protein
MIHKLIIAMLMLGAAAIGVLAYTSFFPPWFLSTDPRKPAFFLCLQRSWLCRFPVWEDKFFGFGVREGTLSLSYVDESDKKRLQSDTSVRFAGFAWSRRTVTAAMISSLYRSAGRRSSYAKLGVPKPALVYNLYMPLWTPFVLCSGYPLIAFIRGPVRRRSRRRRGLCVRCGYDLTGNTSGVCPECAERVPRHCSALENMTKAS